MTLGLDYDVRVGRENDFERAAGQAAAILSSVAGHRRTRVFREVGPRSAYMLLSEWDSGAALAAFVRSPEFAAVQALGPDLLLGAPHHHIFTGDPAVVAAGPEAAGH